MERDLQFFKDYKKTKLLMPYKDDEGIDFSALLNGLSSSNVNSYPWRTAQERQKVYEGIMLIERYIEVPQQERGEFELYRILFNKGAISHLIYQNHFIEVLMLRNKDVKKEDLAGIGLEADSIRKVEHHLLTSKDFKRWCERYASPPTANPYSLQNATHPAPPTPTIPAQVAIDSFEQDRNREIQLQRTNLSQKQKEELVRKRIGQLDELIQSVQKKYGEDILEIQLLSQERQKINSMTHQIKLKPLKQALEAQRKLEIGQLREIIEEYERQVGYGKHKGQEKVIDSEGIVRINQQLLPIDTYKISKASAAELPRLKKALMVIGETGEGKTTLILKLLGYDLKWQPTGKGKATKTLVLSKPLAQQHKELIASGSISSVTSTLTAHRFSYKKEQIFLIDSPGFNDTNGEVVDISNQIALEKAYSSCESICYLYMISLSYLKIGRAIGVIEFAKNIAARFAYKTLQELESMLLIVFNYRGNLADNFELYNLPYDAEELLRKNNYYLLDKDKIALQLIQQRLKLLEQGHSFFQPTEHVENIKTDIVKLKYTSPHRILRKMDKRFEKKVEDYNIILKKNIEFYLENGRTNVARYHYDQFTVLDNVVGLQSTKLMKKIIDDLLKTKVKADFQVMRATLVEKISTLTVNPQEMQAFLAQLTSVKPYIEILKLTDTDQAIKSEINTAFQKVINFINPQASEETINKVLSLCVFFFDGLRDNINQNIQDIQKVCFGKLKEIPKEIAHQYKSSNCKQFDANFKAFTVFYAYYEVFASKFGQFKHLKEIKMPDDLKNEYLAKEQVKYKAFDDCLRLIDGQFANNSEIAVKGIEKLNKSYEVALYLKQSAYVSLLEKIDNNENEVKDRMDKQCANYIREFNRLVQFNEGWQKNIVPTQVLMANLNNLCQSLIIVSIKKVMESTRTMILETINKQFAEFEKELKQGVESIRDYTSKDEYTMLLALNDKLTFFENFEACRNSKAREDSETLKEEFKLFCNELAEALKVKPSDMSAERARNLFQGVKSLRRYKGIEDKMDERIETVRNQLDTYLQKYGVSLKEVITIKEIRSHTDHKAFNQNYIKTMKAYIENVLLNTYDKQDNNASTLHEEVYALNAASMLNIDRLITTCLQIARAPQAIYQGELEAKLAEDHYYLIVLGSIYGNLKKINDKYAQYSRNELYRAHERVDVSVDEMAMKIESLPDDRIREIQGFIARMDNVVRVGTRVAHKRIQVDRCNHYLKELTPLKKLVENLHFYRSSNNQPDDRFTNAQVELLKLVALYQEKVMSRIELAINLETLEIRYKQECSSLYHELVSRNMGESLQEYFDQLRSFMKRKKENYNKILDGCDDLLGKDTINNLNQAINYYVSFASFITEEHKAIYNVTMFEDLDEIITQMLWKILTAIQGRLDVLKDYISNRNFQAVDREVERLSKITMKAVHYLRSKGEGEANGPQLQRVLKINGLIEQLRRERLNKNESDRQVAEEPFKDENLYKLQEVYSNLSKRGELQHQMRIKIEQFFEEKLKDYDTCKFQSSAKLGQEITQFYSYIPIELRSSYDYRDRYNTLKNRKLQWEKKELKKLKDQQGGNSLNEIIYKYHQFAMNQSIEMKEEAYDLIKAEVSAMAHAVTNANRMAAMVETARESFWKVIYNPMVGDAVLGRNDLQGLFQRVQQQIASEFAKVVRRRIDELSAFINEDEPASIKAEALQSAIRDLRHFFTVFRVGGQRVHFNQHYNKMSEEIENKVQVWANLFEMVCPLDQVDAAVQEKELNAVSLKKLVRKCAAKAVAFEIVFSEFKENGEAQTDMDLQPKYSSQILKRIKIFRNTIDDHIKTLRAKLQALQFTDFIELSKQDIESNLAGIDRRAVLLEVYEQSLPIARPLHEYKETGRAEVLLGVRSKLGNFLTSFLSRLEESFKKLEKELPSELYFMEQLFQIISSSGLRKVFSSSMEGQMQDVKLDQFLANPTKEFNAFIDNCLAAFKPQLQKARADFCKLNYYRSKHKEGEAKMQENMNKELNQMHANHKRMVKELDRSNEGKSEEEKALKRQEAEDLFTLNRDQKLEKWNSRKGQLTKDYQKATEAVRKEYARLLLTLQKLYFHLHSSTLAKGSVGEMIRVELDEIRSCKLLQQLSQSLEECSIQDYANLLKRSSPHFKYEQYIEFNRLTAKQDIKYVLSELFTMFVNLNLNRTEKAAFAKLKQDLEIDYNNYKTAYNTLKDNEIDVIISTYKKSDRIQRIAIILAVWSLLEKAKNLDDQDRHFRNYEEGEWVDISPHPVQVVALLLLTMTSPTDELKSQLVQILTGEGKSIVLATLAIYIATTEVPVVVSCYSAYLCDRDAKNFQALFGKFAVTQLISYNTFNEICEKAINNPLNNTQKRVLDVVKGTPIRSGKTGASSKQAVLLIDEVDVFFEGAYFGNTYRPVMKLSDPACREFLKFVFAQLTRDPKVRTDVLAESREFRQLVGLYPRIEHILRNQLYRMKTEFGRTDNEYIVEQQMIKYRDKDQMTEKLHFGYETIFAYCREFARGRISPENYEKALFIPLIYGEFAYSELPKSYSAIMGLSGTIQNLPTEKISYLEREYRIERKNMFILPSIYGTESKRGEAFTIQDDNTYYKFLVESIEKELKRGRPVLVCFRNYSELKKFSDGQQFKSAGLKCAFLHEQLDNDLRDKCIMTVGTPQRLTLMTAEFARGTDFVISDKRVKNNGGLHLILTYITQLRSQLIQFKGRTARQGQDGTIHAIISKTEAASKKVACIEAEEIETNLRGYMDEASREEDKLSQRKLAECLANHNETKRCMQNVAESAQDYLTFLMRLNAVAVVREKPTKIIIGIDGTNSMQKTFDELKRQLRLIMLRIKELQKSNSMNGSFIVQIVVYRNYNTPEKVFEASQLHENLELLEPFLNNIRVDGGMGNEAIELLYRHINLLGEVDMVILIGDAPPNTADEVKKNRETDEWIRFSRRNQSRQPLYIQTSCQKEERKFPRQLIFNGLYINGNKYVQEGSTEIYFKEMASRHQGEAKELNFNKPDYQEILVQFFTVKILTAINGRQNEERINTEYRNRFRSYTS